MSRNESRAWVHRRVLAGLLLGTLGCAGRNVRAGDSADAAENGTVRKYFCNGLNSDGKAAVEVDELNDDFKRCIDPGGTITFDSKCQAVTYYVFAGDKTFDLSQPQPKCLTLADDCQRKMGVIATITLEKGQSCQLTLARGVSSGRARLVVHTNGPGCASQGSAAARIPPLDVIVGKLEVATSTTGTGDTHGPR